MRSRLSRRDVEAFAAVVDGRTPRARAAASSKQLQELVVIADFIRDSSVRTARRDFVADLRAELMLAADAELKPATTSPTPQHRDYAAPAHVRRRLTAAASTFVVVGGSLGLVAASAQAMPGDMLYPVKRATEKVELMIEDGPAEGRALLDHATTRLKEVETLTADSGPDKDDLISQTLADFTADANTGGQMLLEAYREGGSAGDIEDLRGFAAQSAERLEQLADQMPRSAAAEYANAAEAVSGLDSTAVSACPDCNDGTPPLILDGDLIRAVSYVLGDSGSSSSTLAGSHAKPRLSGDDLSSSSPELQLDIELPPSLTVDPNDSNSGQTTDDADDGARGDGPLNDGPGSDLVDGLDDTTDGTTKKLTDGTETTIDRLVRPVTEAATDLIDGTLDTP